MFEEVGVIFGIFIILLYIVVIVDITGIILVFKKDRSDRGEYCTYGIKWTKVAVGILFALVLLYIILTQEFTAYVMWIQLILAVMLLVTEGINTILKIKFGKKR
jgi:amino acid transporter